MEYAGFQLGAEVRVVALWILRSRRNRGLPGIRIEQQASRGGSVHASVLADVGTLERRKNPGGSTVSHARQPRMGGAKFLRRSE